ncbi:hypothetical protein DESA109040_03675 [Deinococcus saxicola]|uniref:hypothetical protein n=1 Tax=Deinococcus saxicola TaxID=249406 RepID=UPI0039EFA8B4
MTECSPLLILSMPAGHEIDPPAWEALKQCAGDSYGAGVVLAAPAFLRAESPVLLGDWGDLKTERLFKAQFLGDVRMCRPSSQELDELDRVDLGGFFLSHTDSD